MAGTLDGLIQCCQEPPDSTQIRSRPWRRGSNVRAPKKQNMKGCKRVFLLCPPRKNDVYWRLKSLQQIIEPVFLIIFADHWRINTIISIILILGFTTLHYQLKYIICASYVLAFVCISFYFTWFVSHSIWYHLRATNSDLILFPWFLGWHWGQVNTKMIEIMSTHCVMWLHHKPWEILETA